MFSIKRLLAALWEETYYPAKSLGLSRKEMPQIRAKDMPKFFEYLKGHGVSTRDGRGSAMLFKPAQREMNADKARIKSSPESLAMPLIVSRDNYVLDGHHRWLHCLWYGKDVNYIRVSCDARVFFKLAHEFEDVEFHDLHQFHSTTPVKGS